MSELAHAGQLVEDWQSIPQAELDRVAADMGVHERTATCVAFDVVRQR